jgi:hypothetical protein
VEHRLNDLLFSPYSSARKQPEVLAFFLFQWAEGVIFQIQIVNPNSDVVMEEQIKGNHALRLGSFRLEAPI